MIDFLNRITDWIMDVVVPIILIGMTIFVLIMLAIMFVELVRDAGKPTLEQTVEACIKEEREDEPDCKFAILKYTRKQNHATVMPVPMIVHHR